jgi:hypothetical protein
MTLAARSLLAGLAPILLFVASCASHPPAPKEYVPPRLDLARYGALGIVEFGGGAKSDLGASATLEFIAAVHAAQPGTPVLELGDLASALPGSARGRVDAAAVRALAEREHVEAIWIGEVTESEGKPRVALDPSYGTASASAERKAKISVRLLDGASGATVWSASSERTIPVVSFDGTLRGLSRVKTTPADEARAILVRDLVSDVTYDLRPMWVQR